MGTAITSGTIGGDLYANPDLIFDDQNLANAGATTSSEFLLAQTMGKTQINIIAGTDAISTGDTYVITIITAPTSGGTFDNTILSQNVTVTTVDAGDPVAQIAIPREVDECYAKLVITTTGDSTSDEVTAYQVCVGG
jgi:hypothetical protein